MHLHLVEDTGPDINQTDLPNKSHTASWWEGF